MSQSLISIIIPTYNRAHLISETIDSIINQSYSCWECLVIDDGSNDNTDKLIAEYTEKDPRIHYLKRPSNLIKGANACRNIGIANAKGDYIVFFDSDDLMTLNHLEVKLNAIHKWKCDYVITRTKYFNKDSSQIDSYYQFDKYEITPHNYVTQKINWLTYDICLKTNLAKSVQFNENLQSGQEYNYFSKLVYKSVNAVFIDEVVTLRRDHNDSIRSQLKTEAKLNQSFFNANWFTYLDVKDVANKDTRRFLLQKVSSYILNERHFFDKSTFQVVSLYYKEIGLGTIYLFLYLFSVRLFGKGNIFKKQFKKQFFS